MMPPMKKEAQKKESYNEINSVFLNAERRMEIHVNDTSSYSSSFKYRSHFTNRMISFNFHSFSVGYRTIDMIISRSSRCLTLFHIFTVSFPGINGIGLTLQISVNSFSSLKL